MNILVTGTAGFIGCEVALQLLARGDTGDRHRQRQRLLRHRSQTLTLCSGWRSGKLSAPRILHVRWHRAGVVFKNSNRSA